MADDAGECRRNARDAREKANRAEGEIRTEYLKIAEMWDLLAREYEAVRNSARE